MYQEWKSISKDIVKYQCIFIYLREAHDKKENIKNSINIIYTIT
jgi:hypothetical protein